MVNFTNIEVEIGEIVFNVNGYTNEDEYGVMDLDDSKIHIEEVVAIIPTSDGSERIEGNHIIESLYGWPQFKNLLMDTIEFK